MRNEWHESSCPDNYLMTGIKFHIFEYWDGSMYHYLVDSVRVRCTRVKIGTPNNFSWGRQSPWVSVNNSYYNAWCPCGKFAVSFTASNLDYGSGSLDFDCKIYLRCKSIGELGSSKSYRPSSVYKGKIER